MSGKKKHRTANEYLRYLKGDLSGDERHDLERGLEADPFEMEAMEGLESISAEEAEEDLLSLHSRLRKRRGRKRRIAFFSAAATVASLLVIGTVFLQIYDFKPEKAEESMIEEEAISIPERSEIPALDEPQSEEAEIPEPKIAPDEDISQDQLIEDSEKMMVAEDMEVDDDMMFPEQAVVSEEIAVALDDVEEVQEIVSQEAAPVQGAATRARTKRSELRKNVEYQPEAEAPKQEKAMAPAAVDYTRMISGQLSGVVLSSEDMQPLPGAIVSLKGSSTGVYTDQDGRFSLPANEDSNTLIASFVGMETGEFPVNKLQDVELVMQPNLLTLDEVVVVGKGVTRPSEPEGSTQIVALEEQNESVDYSLAEPAGGYKAFKEYIAEQMRFPSEDPGISKAIVVLRFTVTRTGQIKDLFALKSPGDEFTGEALRLLKEGPEWIPASRDQKKIDDAVRLRIVFRK